MLTTSRLAQRPQVQACKNVQRSTFNARTNWHSGGRGSGFGGDFFGGGWVKYPAWDHVVAGQGQLQSPSRKCVEQNSRAPLRSRNFIMQFQPGAGAIGGGHVPRNDEHHSTMQYAHVSTPRARHLPVRGELCGRILVGSPEVGEAHLLL